MPNHLFLSLFGLVSLNVSSLCSGPPYKTAPRAHSTLKHGQFSLLLLLHLWRSLLHANYASITSEFLFNSPHLEIVATEVEIACEHALSSCQSSFHLFLISPVLIITQTTRACSQATLEINLKPDSTHAFSLVADEILANEECLQIICCPSEPLQLRPVRVNEHQTI